MKNVIRSRGILNRVHNDMVGGATTTSELLGGLLGLLALRSFNLAAFRPG